MNRWNLRIKITPDGRAAFLLRGCVRVVSITWSKKSNAYNIIFNKNESESDWLKNEAFQDFVCNILNYLYAYKKDIDRMDERRKALEMIINQ